MARIDGFERFEELAEVWEREAVEHDARGCAIDPTCPDRAQAAALRKCAHAVRGAIHATRLKARASSLPPMPPLYRMAPDGSVEVVNEHAEALAEGDRHG